MSRSADEVDVLVLGAGAAGLMAGIEAGRRGRSVLVVDHARSPGEKIRISGGGRCNFTNRDATVAAGRDRFLSHNPRFALSALARYTPADFIDLVSRHGIGFHEKALGQLFCDNSAVQIVTMLVNALHQAGGQLRLATSIEDVARSGEGYSVRLASGPVQCRSLVVATGGKSIPKMGATGIAYRVAAQFGIGVTPTRPALVPLTLAPHLLEQLAPLAGVAVDAAVTAGGRRFAEPVLFTHRGLSGPAVLQASSYWREGEPVTFDLLPGLDPMQHLKAARRATPKLAPQTVLAQHLPRRLAQLVADDGGAAGMIGDAPDARLAALTARVRHLQIKPVGTEGYRTAEVTLGGVDTAALDARTLAARDIPGLFFVGECVDVTGWLGGYNFQWAWSSGWAAGQVA